jgi:hypothetical protein
VKKIAVAVAVANLCVIAAATPAALAHPAAHGAKFKTTASPNKHVKPGTTITVKGKGAKKSTSFFCAQLIIVPKHQSRRVVGSAVTTVMSSPRGRIKCKQRFEPFSGPFAGKTHHCPTTKADRKAGWSCAIGLADAATEGKKSGSLVTFTAKK